MERLRADVYERLNQQNERSDALAQSFSRDIRQLAVWLIGMMLAIATVTLGVAQVT